MIAIVLRRGGAGMVRQDPQQRADGKARDIDRPAASIGDDAMLLVGADDDEVAERPSALVAGQAVALVDRLGRVPRSRDMAIQPASTMIQPRLALVADDAVSTDSAISSGVQTPSPPSPDRKRHKRRSLLR
jgi:hypothetical protein